MRSVRPGRRCLGSAVLVSVAVCAGLAGPVAPSGPVAGGSALHRGDVAAATVDAAMIRADVPVAGGGGEAVVGPYAATEAGLVDVDCRVPGGTAAGTGIVLDSGGVAVTNNHVVAQALSIVATDLADGRRYPVVVLARDPAHDVAVIRLVGAVGVAVAPIGDSGRLRVGDWVSAIGNAGGRGGAPTVTSGTVIALGRSIVSHDEATHQRRRLSGMIEVSAAVPAGDSGGALLGRSGVVGMNTSNGPTSGFAIPIDTVIGIARAAGAQRSPRPPDAPGQAAAASASEGHAVDLLRHPVGG